MRIGTPLKQLHIIEEEQNGGERGACKREVYGKRDERNEGIVRILTRLIAGVCCVVTSGV